MNANELRNFTGPKRFQSTLQHDGSTFEIEIETPDLGGVEPSVWGDWGPMYTFQFAEPRAVRVSFRAAAGSIEDGREIPVSKVHLDSPMHFEKRQEYPFLIRFQHPALGLEFSGYLNQQGEPAFLEAKQVPLEADVVSLLLWQPPRTGDWHGVDRKVA